MILKKESSYRKPLHYSRPSLPWCNPPSAHLERAKLTVVCLPCVVLLSWVFGGWLRTLTHSTGMGRKGERRIKFQSAQTGGKEVVCRIPLGSWPCSQASSTARQSSPRNFDLTLVSPKSDLFLHFSPFWPLHIGILFLNYSLGSLSK